MRVVVVTVCKNEQRMLPYFIRHYREIADEFVFFDNESTDDTAKIIAELPNAHRISYGTLGYEKEEVLTLIRNHANLCLKLKADWFIIVDTDELLYHPDLRRYLKHCLDTGVDVPRTLGFNMYHESFPENDTRPLIDIVRRGVRAPGFNKLAITRPGIVMNYSYGSHSAEPQKGVRFSEDIQVLLLHCRMREIGLNLSLAEYRMLRNKRFSQVSSQLIERNQSGETRHARIMDRGEALAFAAPVYVKEYHAFYEELCEKAHEGDPLARYQVGFLIHYGHFQDADCEEAIPWIEYAADHGVAYAQYHMGYLHVSYEKWNQDLAKAYDYFQRAAEQGHAEAQNRMGGLCLKQPAFFNYEAAEYWLLKASDQGVAQAQYDLANLYANPEFVGKDLERSAQFMEMAANNHFLQAMYHMAETALERGDRPSALEWYRKVAERGQLKGYWKVDELLADARYIPNDYASAKKAFQYMLLRSNGPL